MAKSRLVILRGPSGAGKSTVAKELLKQTQKRTTLIGQDYYRFIFKPSGGAVNSKTIHKMIKANVLTALEDGYDVILEGIFNMKPYKETFAQIFVAHPSDNYIFTFDISFEETLRRHRTKSNKDEWSETDMRDWYHPKDFMGYDFEHIVTEASSVSETVRRIKNVMIEAK